MTVTRTRMFSASWIATRVCACLATVLALSWLAPRIALVDSDLR